MNLQDIMIQKGKTQYRLSKESGVSQAQISRIISGKCQPGLVIINKLATALGVTVAELLNDSPINLSA